METSGLFFSFFSFTFLTGTVLSATICQQTSCGSTEPPIQFPFRLKHRQSNRCGYPGFDLSCNNQNHTILTLPYSGDFIVRRIDYTNQFIYINDPNFCLPKRMLNFSLSGTQFESIYWGNLTFLNCSSEGSGDYGYVPIYCFDGRNRNYTVYASDSNFVPSGCEKMETVTVPVEWPYYYRSSRDLEVGIQLTWGGPFCGRCEYMGGTCGFEGDTNKIVCSNVPSRGLPRSAKYGIIIGVGIPGLVFLTGLSCYICSKVRNYSRRRRYNAEITNLSMVPQPIVVVTGLDGPTIESYPKTVLGESRRLPRPNDGTCPICLAEYQPKETLRTIPECNHYFHATCVDEWLKLNATCPLCRKSPAESSVVTPCSSMSSTSSSTSSQASQPTIVP